jgi:hypothetical protein
MLFPLMRYTIEEIRYLLRQKATQKESVQMHEQKKGSEPAKALSQPMTRQTKSRYRLNLYP